MLPDQYVYGFTSKEEAENALQKIAQSINRHSHVDLSLNTDQSVIPNNQTKYFDYRSQDIIPKQLFDFWKGELILLDNHCYRQYQDNTKLHNFRLACGIFFVCPLICKRQII